MFTADAIRFGVRNVPTVPYISNYAAITEIIAEIIAVILWLYVWLSTKPKFPKELQYFTMMLCVCLFFTQFPLQDDKICCQIKVRFLLVPRKEILIGNPFR